MVKKNHRQSLNKSLERLSQRSSVEVFVDRLTVMNDIFNGSEKESHVVLKKVTRETVTKDQCRGACRPTYSDYDMFNDDDGIFERRDEEMPTKKKECMQKKKCKHTQKRA